MAHNPPSILQAAHALVSADEVALLEAAWASGQRLVNANIQLKRGDSTVSETLISDVTGISRTSAKQWELIQLHLPRTLGTDHIAYMLVNGKIGVVRITAGSDVVTNFKVGSR